MLGGLNFMLRGLPFIYQGQELGMENVKFESIDQVDDISSLDEYKVALEAGCTPEEALKAVSDSAAIMPEHRCSGQMVRMQDLRQVNHG